MLNKISESESESESESDTLPFYSCHRIAGFLVDELQT